MKTYNKRIWLNKESLPSMGNVVAFDGDVDYIDGKERTIFLAISDCSKTVKIIKNTESICDYIKKLKTLSREIDLFINHLQEKQKPRNLITEKIVKVVFTARFNDGRYKRGRVGISGSEGDWYINTVQHYVGKHIKTIKQLDKFLIKEGVPFDFSNILNKQLKPKQ